MLVIPQEGSLEGTGVGCSPVPKDEQKGKKTDVDEQTTFADTPGEKECVPPNEEVTGNSRRVYSLQLHKKRLW